ncbi:MAG: isoprenylcysteine carboxylmethyltransferase family protein [Bacteroidales bacterium]
MKSFLNYYLIVYFIIYYALVFVWVSYRVKRKTGINPYLFKNSDTPHDFLGVISKFVTLVLIIVLLVNAFLPDYYKYFLPMWYIEDTIVQSAGLTFIHVAFVWILIAQLQMDKSWRIGFDKQQHTELKTNGLFKFSRNPVFLGMSVSLFGIFLVIPNAFTLLVFVLGFVSFHLQIRLEEEYLKNSHSESYTNYCQKVGRWF